MQHESLNEAGLQICVGVLIHILLRAHLLLRQCLFRWRAKEPMHVVEGLHAETHICKTVSQRSLQRMSVPDVAMAKEMLAIMENQNLQPLRKLDQLIGYLKKNQLAHVATLLPTDLLIHPHNRGGAMVNSLDVHEKGSKLLALGFRKSLLQDSFCIELSPDQRTREQQVAANQQLAQKSGGLLSSVLGTERPPSSFSS